MILLCISILGAKTPALNFSKAGVLGHDNLCCTTAFFLLPSCGISNLNSPIDIVLSPHRFRFSAEHPPISVKEIALVNRVQASLHGLLPCDMDICRKIVTYSRLFRLSERFTPTNQTGELSICGNAPLRNFFYNR